MSKLWDDILTLLILAGLASGMMYFYLHVCDWLQTLFLHIGDYL